MGVVIAPRSDRTDDWDNYRIQDGEIGYVPEMSRYVMLCNMYDDDGSPGASFPNLPDRHTRVIGTFYSRARLGKQSSAGGDN
jgi:hypothetical protein